MNPKIWQALGRKLYRQRKAVLGDRSRICNGCTDIFLCEGPIAFEACEVIDRLVAQGSLKASGEKGALWSDRGGRLPQWPEEIWASCLRTAEKKLVVKALEEIEKGEERK